MLSHPSSTFTKHLGVKPAAPQSKRSVAVQRWAGRWGSGCGARAQHSRYWSSFATWWQLLGENREISRTGLEGAGRAHGAGLDPCTRAAPAPQDKPQARGSITPTPNSARWGWNSPRCPASSLARAPAAPGLKCVPKPSSTVGTVRQHSAFCNFMLLYPNLFSWKKTKACRFYDVNLRILGV